MSSRFNLSRGQVIPKLECPNGHSNLFSPGLRVVIVTKKTHVVLGCRECFKDPQGRPSYREYSFKAIDIASYLDIDVEVIEDEDTSIGESTEDMEGVTGARPTEDSSSELDQGKEP